MSARRLRWDAEVVRHDEGFVVRDHFGARPDIEMDRATGIALGALLSGATAKDIDARLEREFGATVDLRELRALARSLDLLESPRASAAREARWLESVANGALWLPNLPAPQLAQNLRTDISRWLDDAAAPDAGRVFSGLAPHGDLPRTGDLSARLYARLRAETWPDVFIVLGTSHFDPTPSVLTLDVVAPFGRIQTDPLIARECLRALPRRATRDSPAFLLEHSIRMDLPILQICGDRVTRTPRVVLVMCGDMTALEAERFAERLEASLFERRARGLLIASGDLTHVGPGYPWAPPFEMEPERLDEQLRRYEAPVIEALLSRDIGQYAALCEPTSFCARAQVAAAQRFALDRGHWLGDRSVSLGERGVFRAGVAAFEQGPTRLCPEVLFKRTGDTLSLLHRCDNHAIQIPVDAFAVLSAFQVGVELDEVQRRVLERTGAEVELDELREFLETLASQGFIDCAGAESNRRRAVRVLEDARANVPAYGDHPPTWTGSPIIRSGDLRARWSEYLRRGITLRAATQGKAFFRRTSSGSTRGQPLLSVVEKEVAAERTTIAPLVTGLLVDEKRANINRPHNLFDDRRRDAKKFLAVGSGGHWRIAPGPNPTTVPPRDWDRAIDLLMKDPPRVLSGEASYLAGLAHRMTARGLVLRDIELVELGHCYALELYRAAIARAFPIPQRRLYHTSEVGVVAVECALGFMHLNEANLHTEIIDDEIVVTTLDTAVRPLIRYALGDRVSEVAEHCRCGRPFRVVDVRGRREDVITIGKRVIDTAALDRALGAPPDIAFARFVLQRRSVTLELVPLGEAYRQPRALERSLYRAVGCPVKVVERRHLVVPPRGKLLPVMHARRESRKK